MIPHRVEPVDDWRSLREWCDETLLELQRRWTVEVAGGYSREFGTDDIDAYDLLDWRAISRDAVETALRYVAQLGDMQLAKELKEVLREYPERPNHRGRIIPFERAIELLKIVRNIAHSISGKPHASRALADSILNILESHKGQQFTYTELLSIIENQFDHIYIPEDDDARRTAVAKAVALLRNDEHPIPMGRYVIP